MRAYYINLATRMDRRDAMEGRFTALGISAERVNALTPADLTDAQRTSYCNRANRRWKSEPELSCSLTHVKAMERFLQTGEAYAAIFEDDAVLSPSLGRFLDQFEKAGLAIDLLHLETDNERFRLPPAPEARLDEFGFYRLYSAGGGSAGYICSRRAAERIVAGEEIRIFQTDQAMFWPHGPVARDLVMRQLVPGLVIQEDRFGMAPGERRKGSDLEALRQARRHTNQAHFWRRAHFNLLDFVRRDIIDANYNRWVGLTRGVGKRPVVFKVD